MSEWYGAEGKAFPVGPGQVWQCGEHVFHCGQLHDFPGGPIAMDVVYCDPPWNDSLLRSFHTKAGYERPGYGWLDIYKLIIAKLYVVPVWLEGGVAQTDEIMGILPGPVTAKWDITYYKTRPAILVYSGHEEPWCDPLGMDDEDTPGFVLERHPRRGVVCDPCAGRGTTALAAERAGWRSITNELNPARVSAALARMQKLTGKTPGRLA